LTPRGEFSLLGVNHRHHDFYGVNTVNSRRQEGPAKKGPIARNVNKYNFFVADFAGYRGNRKDHQNFVLVNRNVEID
jgi:hypothetical protein